MSVAARVKVYEGGSSSLAWPFGSRTVSYNPPRHIGVGFSCDF